MIFFLEFPKYFPKVLYFLFFSFVSNNFLAEEESQHIFVDFGPLFGVVIGFLTATVLITIIIVLICKINRRNRGAAQHQKHSSKPDQNFRPKFNNHSIKENSLLDFQDTKSPDIIPPSIEFSGNV